MPRKTTHPTYSPKVVEVVEVHLTGDAEGPPFSLTYFGIPHREFFLSPGGGTKIAAFLGAHGLRGHLTTSPFLIEDNTYNKLSEVQS